MIVYDTVSAAVNDLKKRGYVLDFNMHENCIVCHAEKIDINDFEIVEVHRFEGDSDPSDEAVVYAIQSKNGMKGVLVNGYGISAESIGSDLAKKLNVHRK